MALFSQNLSSLTGRLDFLRRLPPKLSSKLIPPAPQAPENLPCLTTTYRMSPNKTATKEISAPQTSTLQTSAPQTSTSPVVLLNPWGGLKQLADLTLDLDAMVAWQLERHLHWPAPAHPGHPTTKSTKLSTSEPLMSSETSLSWAEATRAYGMNMPGIDQTLQVAKETYHGASQLRHWRGVANSSVDRCPKTGCGLFRCGCCSCLLRNGTSASHTKRGKKWD